jgi:hypothetical protein
MQGSEDLRKLLHIGWEVKGFTHRSEAGDASSEKGAGGYAILLQKSEQMAVVQTLFDPGTGEHSVTVNILTGAL